MTRQVAGTVLVVLVVFVSSIWLQPPAASQERFRLRGWAFIDFREDPRASLERLWAEAGAEGRPGTPPAARRWPRVREAERPDGAVLRISLVQALLKGGPWDAVVLIGANSEKDLLAAARYIEQFYSHVEIYGVVAERQ